MHTKLSIPERLKDLRVVDKHLTLEQLAEQTGLSKSALSKYESDDYKDISPFAIATLAEFYGMQWDGCRKETDYYEKSYGSRRNSDFRDIQVDVKDNSWSVEAGLRTCQDNSSSIRYGGKDISFIRKNGHILRGGEHICRLRVYS